MSLSQIPQTIFKCEPFVCALKGNQKSIRCDHCFKSLETQQSVMCDTCLKYWYCSDSCLNSHSVVHRFECHPNYDLAEVIAKKCSAPVVRDESDWCKFSDLDEMVTQTLLLLRILFRLKSEPSCVTKAHPMGNGLSVSYDQIRAPVCQQMHKVWDDEDICDTDNGLN
ncbi:unnamed protein product, partial [Oppiella nova]